MTVAEKLVALLKAQGLTCATAESCTGGGVGSAITAVPGSSAVFAGGIISYANEVKRDVLGVAAQALDEYGAVSPQVAAQMAEGARRLLKTDLAVSLTGIAGPDGGSGSSGSDSRRRTASGRRRRSSAATARRCASRRLRMRSVC